MPASPNPIQPEFGDPDPRVAHQSCAGDRDSRGQHLNKLADEHGGVPMGLLQDALGNHFTVVKGLSGQPHVGQAAGVDELEHLKQTNKAQPYCGSFPCSPPTS